MNKILIKRIKNLNIIKRINEKENSASLIETTLNIKYSDLSFNEYNKPYLNGKTFFNISHSKGYIGIAVSNEEIGFDLEIDRIVNKKLTKKIYNENDYTYSKESDILKVFTIKEAYLKCLGIGLKLDLNNILIDYELNTIKYKDYDSLYFKTFKVNDIIFSVVTKSNENFSITLEDLNEKM